MDTLLWGGVIVLAAIVVHGTWRFACTGRIVPLLPSPWGRRERS